MKMNNKATWRIARELNNMLNKELNANHKIDETGNAWETIVKLVNYCLIMGIDISVIKCHCGSSIFNEKKGREIPIF